MHSRYQRFQSHNGDCLSKLREHDFQSPRNKKKNSGGGGHHQQVLLYPTLSRLAPPVSSHQRHDVSSSPRTPPPRVSSSSSSSSHLLSRQQRIMSPPVVQRVTSSSAPFLLKCERIGDPSLNIYCLKLPTELIHRIDGIISQSEKYAATLPTGWKTDLYSLTKQDLALQEIPGMIPRIKPIYDYIVHAIQVLYGCQRVVCDRNQPHILKYSVHSGHTGVELHHDRCDVTANMVLSAPQDYEGGGTFIPEIGSRILRLNKGDVLLHPGTLIHGGVNIRKGVRYLMVLFADLH